MTSLGDATLIDIPFFCSFSSTSSYPIVRLQQQQQHTHTHTHTVVVMKVQSVCVCMYVCIDITFTEILLLKVLCPT